MTQYKHIKDEIVLRELDNDQVLISLNSQENISVVKNPPAVMDQFSVPVLESFFASRAMTLRSQLVASGNL